MSRLILVILLILMAAAAALAQTSKQNPTIGELQKEFEETRSQMAQMRIRIAALEAASGTTATNSSTDPTVRENETPPQALRSQSGEKKSSEEPTSFQFKGLTLTLGGFLEGTLLVRTRNENADIANN